MAFSVIDSWVAAGTADAVAAAVVRPGGEVVERRLAGRAEERSLFALASLTKPIVALAAMVAAEEGAVDLDRPIADHLAAYADPGRRDITLRHLLSHTSGLPEVGREVAPLDVAPVHRPATRRIYSNVGFHIVAALLTAATGMPFQRYVDEAVLAPLGGEVLGDLRFDFRPAIRRGKDLDSQIRDDDGELLFLSRWNSLLTDERQIGSADGVGVTPHDETDVADIDLAEPIVLNVLLQAPSETCQDSPVPLLDRAHLDDPPLDQLPALRGIQPEGLLGGERMSDSLRPHEIEASASDLQEQ